MKKIMNSALSVALIGLLFVCTANAELKATGSGDSMGIDTTGFPPDMVESYKVMEVKCKKCHSLERAVVAIQAGLGPISGDVFDKSSTEIYGIKMLRKPDSGMNKDEVKKVIKLLDYLIDLAAK